MILFLAAWIGFYNELIFQILAHLCARKLAQVTYFFLEWHSFIYFVSTHILSCVGYSKVCLAVISASQSIHAMIFVHLAWRKSSFTHTQGCIVVKKPNGMLCILLRRRYKQPILSLKSLFHIFSYRVSFYCYSHCCSDCAATVTVLNLFRASLFSIAHPLTCHWLGEKMLWRL